MPKNIKYTNQIAYISHNNSIINTSTQLSNGKFTDSENEYLEFKKKIMSDNNIDNKIKSILLHNKKELVNKKNILKNEYFLIKSLELDEFMSLLEIKSSNSKEYLTHMKFLIPKIKNYRENKIKTIFLEFEMCFDIYNLIDKTIYNEEKRLKLFEIFKPYDIDEFNNYIKIIEISKKDYINKENEEKMRTENEEKNKIEKTNREKIIKIILNNFKKLSYYDNEIKQIQFDTNKPIQKFLNLETECIEFNLDLSIRFYKFINSIRIEQEEKTNIFNVCKVIK